MDTYPPRSALVADSECSVPCPAYIIASCGGKDAYSVYNVGIQLSIEHQEEQDGFAGTGEDANPEGEVSAAPEAAKEEL